MAGLLDIYGDLLSPEQRKALEEQDLWSSISRATSAAADLAMPQRAPVGIGAVLGKVGAALGGGGGENLQNAIAGMSAAEKIKQARQERAWLDQVSPFVKQALERKFGGGLLNPNALTPGASPTPGGAAPFLPQPGGGGSNAPPPPPNDAYPPVPPGVKFEPGPQPPGVFPPMPGPSVGMGGAEALPDLPAKSAAYGGAPDIRGLLQLASMSGGTNPLDWLTGGGAGAGAPPFAAGPGAGGPDLGNFTAADAGGGGDDWPRARELIRKYESGGRNIEQQVIGPQGGYNPSVGRVTGPSSASGFYQMIDPTWRSAAAKVGIDTKQYPRAIDAPEPLQDKAAEALYREQGLRPWAPYNSRLAAATGYSGGGEGGRVRVEPLAGEAAPAGGGVIPGLGTDAEGLALLDAALKLGGVKNSPFGSLLETYYKSPGYLATAKRATEEVETEFAGRKAEAAAASTQKYILEQATHKSGLDLARDLIGKGVYMDKETGTMKPITNAAEAFAAIEDAKPTPDIKDYRAYEKDQQMRGLPVLPIGEWDINRRRAPSSTTVLNTVEGVAAAEQKARLDIDKELASEAGKKALAARQLMPLLDEALVIARKTPESMAGVASLKLAQVASLFGIAPTPGQSNAELLGSINQRLIPMVREPGATAALEMDKYLAAGPGLMATADGRVKIAEMTKAMGQRAIEIAKVYRDNMGKPDLYEKLAQFDKPLFTDEQRVAMDAAMSGAATSASPAAPAAPPGAITTPYGTITPVR